MARAASGTVAWDNERGIWRGRITLNDGARPWIDGPQGLPRNERGEMRAREYISERAEIARREGLIASDFGIKPRKKDSTPPAGETCDQFYERYHDYQVELGRSDVVTKRSRWKKWLSPRIGSKPMISVTRDDVENIRDDLDAAILAWLKHGRAEDRVSGKTSMNVWSCLTSTFKAATSSKRRDLRVLEGRPNPCTGVEPPGDRDSRKVRQKSFVYPREAMQLLSCEAIDLPWREVYAIALYTYLRPGELRVLTVGDVDLDANIVHVTKAWDYTEERVKPPKTRNGIRRVPIESSLRPLLERLCKGRKPTDLLVPIMSTVPENTLAETFRADLVKAEVTRDELHRDTLTHVQSNFRSCRDSGITWMAIAGVDVTKMMRRAGHDGIQTTMGYVKQAEDLSGELGVPFCPLPEALVSGVVQEEPKSAESLRRARDSNPWYPCRHT